MTWVIVLSTGYYYQQVSPSDWRPSSSDSATRFESREAAEKVAKRLRRWDAEVEAEEDEDKF